MDLKDVFSRGLQQQQVKARSLFLGAVRVWGIALTELARQLRISPAGVTYAVQRGEVISKDNGYRLI